MKCPQCNGTTDVLETREARRRRRCGCGFRFTTREIIEPDRVPVDASTNKAVLAFNGDKLVHYFKSMRATEAAGYDFSCVRRAAAGEHKTHAGLRWVLAETFTPT